MNHGGKREGAGRPATGVKYRKFSVACTHEEYEKIKKIAEEEEKSISRILVDSALALYSTFHI